MGEGQKKYIHMYFGQISIGLCTAFSTMCTKTSWTNFRSILLRSKPRKNLYRRTSGNEGLLNVMEGVHLRNIL